MCGPSDGHSAPAASTGTLANSAHRGLEREPRAPRPRVVIVGGGFGGLYAARGLARARRRHHHRQEQLPPLPADALSGCDRAPGSDRRSDLVGRQSTLATDAHARAMPPDGSVSANQRKPRLPFERQRLFVAILLLTEHRDRGPV